MSAACNCAASSLGDLAEVLDGNLGLISAAGSAFLILYTAARGEPRGSPTRGNPGEIFYPGPRTPGENLGKPRGKMNEKTPKICQFC